MRILPILILTLFFTGCTYHMVDRNGADFKISNPASNYYKRFIKYQDEDWFQNLKINDTLRIGLDSTANYQMVRASNFQALLDNSDSLTLVFLNPNCSYVEEFFPKYASVIEHEKNIYLLSISHDILKMESVKQVYPIFNNTVYVVSHDYGDKMMFNQNNFLKELSAQASKMYNDELSEIEVIKFYKGQNPKAFFDIDSLLRN